MPTSLTSLFCAPTAMIIGRQRSHFPTILLGALFVVAALADASAVYAQQNAPNRAQQASPPDKIWVDDANHDGIDPDAPLRFSSLSNLAEKLSPAVVNIIVTYGHGDKIERLLGKGDWTGATPQAQGTGFIIHPDGYILTNNHVVDDAKAIKIKLLDETVYSGRVVGVDPQTDIALVKISADRPLPTIALGDSQAARVGEHVIAIGNPLGLSHTVTTGIISALGRRDLDIDDKNYVDFIQTDASINPGNSGGPLIGLTGEVIGINTAINRNGQGIGFAIPIDMVKKLLPHLARDGYVVRSWLGIRVQALDTSLARSFGRDTTAGALVTEVIDRSPAAKGGIEAGDIILRFDDTTLRGSDKLAWLASTAGAGRAVDVKLLRNGTTKTVQVELEKLPDQDRPDIPKPPQSSVSRPTQPDIGLQVKALNASLARQLGASDTNGVVVTSVGDASVAQGAGLRQRDVITEVGRTTVTDSAEFGRAVRDAEAGDIIRLKIVRGGHVVYIAVEK